jgi:hypothetical protein
MADKDLQSREVIVIARDDAWAHAYTDTSALVRDARANASNADTDTLEFFDSSGRRLEPVFSRRGYLKGLEASACAAEPAELSRRLSMVVDQVAAREGVAPQAAVTMLPKLAGRTLSEQFTEFSHHWYPHPPRHRWWLPRTIVRADRGSFFHNALHAAGWTHP